MNGIAPTGPSLLAPDARLAREKGDVIGGGKADTGQFSFTSDPSRTILFISFFSAMGGPEIQKML